MMYTIGIDPHKRSHTVVAVDEAENEVARRRVIAGPDQLAELTGFASTLDGECRWAIEAATGVGLLLAQQFTRAGIDVVDVPPTLAARVRLLGSGRTAKTDRIDAHSIAVAAIRHPRLRAVPVEDHTTQLRLIVDRHLIEATPDSPGGTPPLDRPTPPELGVAQRLAESAPGQGHGSLLSCWPVRVSGGPPVL